MFEVYSPVADYLEAPRSLFKNEKIVNIFVIKFTVHLQLYIIVQRTDIYYLSEYSFKCQITPIKYRNRTNNTLS